MIAATTLDQIRNLRSHGLDVYEIARKLGNNADAGNGANMDAVIFRNVVVKWVRNPSMALHDAAGTDVAFYNTVAAADRPHFAACVQADEFIVQERCRSWWNCAGSWDELTHVAQNAVMLMLLDVALRYNLFDLHTGNIGFRMNDDDIDVPVIFDYSGQTDLRRWYSRYGAERTLEYINLPWNACHKGAKVRANMVKMIDAYFAK